MLHYTTRHISSTQSYAASTFLYAVIIKNTVIISKHQSYEFDGEVIDELLRWGCELDTVY